MADTEYILEHFQDLSDGPFASLSSALRDLAAMPETLAPAHPPLLPSQVTEVVRAIGRGAKRTSAIVVATISAVAATTIAAAALTGVGPKPVVNFAKSTVKAIENVTKKIFNFTPAQTTVQDLQTAESAPTQGAESIPVPVETTQAAVPAPLPTPVPVTPTRPVAPQPTPVRTSHETPHTPTPTISSGEKEKSSETEQKSDIKVEASSEAKTESKNESAGTTTEKASTESKTPVITKTSETTKTSAPTEVKKTTEAKSSSEGSSEGSKD